jgi:predicted nucleic acid-binding protein
MGLRFVDTNILIYSISTASADVEKRQRAISILSATDLALSVQVFQEFYVQATRSSRAFPLSHDQACRMIAALQRYPVQENNMVVLQSALDIRNRYQLSFWDSSILAAARELGCKEVLSEDLQNSGVIAGVRIINPFQ